MLFKAHTCRRIVYAVRPASTIFLSTNMPTDRLSGPGKQRKSPGNGQNKWDDNQRLVLYLLFTEFNLQPDARTRLFNKLFQDHLVSCKSPNGLPTGALCSQYNERKKRGQAWARVLSGPKTAEEQAEREAYCHHQKRSHRASCLYHIGSDSSAARDCASYHTYE